MSWRNPTPEWVRNTQRAIQRKIAAAERVIERAENDLTDLQNVCKHPKFDTEDNCRDCGIYNPKL